MRNREYSWFSLASAPGFGVKSIHYIFGSLEQRGMSIGEVFELSLAQLAELLPEIGKGRFSRANFSALNQLDEEQLYGTFEKLKSENVHIVTLDDERYPRSVLENMRDNAPPILYCRGYLPLLNTTGVSIVGSRNVDEFVVTQTKSIASKLAESGLNVISGYAKGVDTSAHLGALDAGGTTSMILSFGVDHITIKREMRELDWEKNSLFITQFAPNEKFSGPNAMIRNKLVCAMSKALVVMASGPEKDSQGKMSGTFEAACAALKMNIPVFVFSPDVLEPTPQGISDLIKIGAIPFADGNDFIKLLEDLPQENNASHNDSPVKSNPTPPPRAAQMTLF